MMTFEQAAAALSARQKSDLARFVLTNTETSRVLTETERIFCFGLSVFCEYEQREEAERFLLSPEE